MSNLKKIFSISGLIGIAILLGVGFYFYKINDNFQKFKDSFQETTREVEKQAANPESLINVKINDVYLTGDYETIETLIKNHLQRSLEFENSYRQQKNNMNYNHLFTVDYLEKDPSLIEARSILDREDLLISEMYKIKSEKSEKLLADANQVQLSTDKKTAQFQQNFRIFFSQYVKFQEQILALDKQHLAAKRNMLHFLETTEWTIKNHQLIFADPNNLQQYQYLQNEIKRTHLEKVSMQIKTLRSFLTIY